MRTLHLDDGVERVVVRADPPDIEGLGRSVFVARAQFTIMRRSADGGWLWRWDKLTHVGVLLVRGLPVADGGAVRDADSLDYAPARGGPIALSALVVLADQPRLEISTAVSARQVCARWRDDADGWSLKRDLVDVHDAWLVFPGPGARPRALPRVGSRRALFVVPRAAVIHDDDVVADVGSSAIVERRGICSLDEVIAMTDAQGAQLEPSVALDIAAQLIERAPRALSPSTVEVEATGALVFYAAPSESGRNENERLLSLLARLLCCEDQPARAAAVLAPHFGERRATRLFAGGIGMSRAELLSALRAMSPAPVSSLSAVVLGLFGPRAGAERDFDDQIAALDDAAIDALAR